MSTAPPTTSGAPQTDHEEEIEGEDLPKQALDTYPLDNLLIRTEVRANVDVLRRIDQKMIVLDPDFQREFIWEEDRQSRLIESVLMRIPLPVFYFAENAEGRLVVVDGLQRLSTLKRFHKGELVLKIPSSRELHGKTFQMLPQKLQNRFEDGQLTLYLIDPKVPDRVRLDIFDRVNSGIALTRQQMRNALYNGPATRLLRDLAVSGEFLSATDGILSTEPHRKSMRDREVVNRFLAFYVLGWMDYVNKATAAFDDFLGSALEQVNKLTDSERVALADAFRKSMRVNHHIFGDRAFRKYSSPRERRKPFNVALFDVFSVVFARYDESRILSQEKDVRDACNKLIQQREYLNAISYATTSPENVRTRFQLAESKMKEVIGDP